MNDSNFGSKLYPSMTPEERLEMDRLCGEKSFNVASKTGWANYLRSDAL
jgi:hypothetical protein